MISIWLDELHPQSYLGRNWLVISWLFSLLSKFSHGRDEIFFLCWIINFLAGQGYSSIHLWAEVKGERKKGKEKGKNYGTFTSLQGLLLSCSWQNQHNFPITHPNRKVRNISFKMQRQKKRGCSMSLRASLDVTCPSDLVFCINTLDPRHRELRVCTCMSSSAWCWKASKTGWYKKTDPLASWSCAR